MRRAAGAARTTTVFASRPVAGDSETQGATGKAKRASGRHAFTIPNAEMPLAAVVPRDAASPCDGPTPGSAPPRRWHHRVSAKSSCDGHAERSHTLHGWCDERAMAAEAVPVVAARRDRLDVELRSRGTGKSWLPSNPLTAATATTRGGHTALARTIAGVHSTPVRSACGLSPWPVAPRRGGNGGV
jgi:hypothetical protein